MKSKFALRQVGVVSLLVALIAGQSTVLAYPSGSPIPPIKPKAMEINRFIADDPVAYPTGAPKPKAAA